MLVSLHINGYHVVSPKPKYAAALSLCQKYPAPKRLLDHIYAHFCSPKYYLALHVSDHIAQLIFILIRLSQGTASAAKALPDSSQAARQQGIPVAPSMEDEKTRCVLASALLIT